MIAPEFAPVNWGVDDCERLLEHAELSVGTVQLSNDTCTSIFGQCIA